MNYDQFILSKNRIVEDSGFQATRFNPKLFDFQKHIVKIALKKGKFAIFADCGLGKTAMQLEWANKVNKETGKPVLVLTPLAVSKQTEREGYKFGYESKVVSNKEEVINGINITNYDKLEHFDCSVFSGVVLDESSILKNFTGKTRRMLTSKFSETQYRLCCTATPSPNDYTEFGQHADFLGVCSPGQMLATFFINDTFNTGDWRLKKHAEKPFWQWVASWAACLSKPSDIGYDDTGYNLPALHLETILVPVDIVTDKPVEELFRTATLSATTMHKEMRLTSLDRSTELAKLVNNSSDCWLVWCNTNDEADHLSKLIPDAVEVRGSDTAAKKEKYLNGFALGEYRVLVTKAGIAGMGLNYQNCSHVAFVGLSYSFEDFYQALRRSYRFGQTKEVYAYIVQAETEGAILQSIHRKINQHQTMQRDMKEAAKYLIEAEKKEQFMKVNIEKKSGNNWELYHGDCVRVAKQLDNDSVDFCVFSPPFASLFVYSNDMQDMGNCSDMNEFTKHFEILITELERVMVPGREVAVHCVDLLATKWKDGAIQFQDFSGEIVRAFWRHGFLFHSRITIWKSPVTEMQRTKAHGLLYKTLCADSTDSRVGCADYLLVFRKKGDNPKPVTKEKNRYPVDWWQEVASPVWMTIDQGNVLNKDGAKDNADEKHICPLQLDVIERAVALWSNPNDLVYSPFAGIGSEGYQAVKMGRKFVGSELKESYFNQACQNLESAFETSKTLF